MICSQEMFADANFIARLYPSYFERDDVIDENIPFLHQIKSDFKSLYDLVNIYSQNQVKTEEIVKISVVGSFSCGKSSFINSILGDDVAPVEITPKTHGITRFLYGESEEYRADNKVITKVEYQRRVQGKSDNTRRFSISYPCDRLKKIELIDSPGFNSVSGKSNKDELSKSDNSLCEKVVVIADVVFFLVNITEGTIKENECEWLNKISEKNNNSLIYIILTWVDKKTKEERKTVLESIKKTCEQKKNKSKRGIVIFVCNK